MRKLLISILWIGLATTVAADPSHDSSSNCFKRLSNETDGADTINVVTRDSVTVRGTSPIFSSSLLTLWTVNELKMSSRITIPLENIDRISYSKPSHARWGFLLLGFGAGVVGGAAAGAAMAPESHDIGDWPELSYGIVGGIVGALIGAAIGHEIGKNITTTVTLKCP